MIGRISVYLTCAGLALAVSGGVSWAQQILDRAEATGIVQVQNLRAEENRVSGEIVNNSRYPVRDVQVLISRAWRWQNEFRPGAENPGISVYHRLDEEVAPGERAAFTHQFAESLREDLSGGEFETQVSVTEYTSVIPQ